MTVYSVDIQYWATLLRGGSLLIEADSQEVAEAAALAEENNHHIEWETVDTLDAEPVEVALCTEVSEVDAALFKSMGGTIIRAEGSAA